MVGRACSMTSGILVCFLGAENDHAVIRWLMEVTLEHHVRVGVQVCMRRLAMGVFVCRFGLQGQGLRQGRLAHQWRHGAVSMHRTQHLNEPVGDTVDRQSHNQRPYQQLAHNTVAMAEANWMSKHRLVKRLLGLRPACGCTTQA